MDQRLSVIHKVVPQGGNLTVEDLILIKKLLHKVLIAGGDDIFVPGIHGFGTIRLRQHQILCNVAQLRVGEEFDLLFLLLPIHHQVCGGQHGLGQKVREIFAKMAVDPVRRQLLAKVFVGRNVLHGEGSHGFVIIIDLWNEIRSKAGFQLQSLRLDLVSV